MTKQNIQNFYSNIIQPQDYVLTVVVSILTAIFLTFLTRFNLVMGITSIVLLILINIGFFVAALISLNKKYSNIWSWQTFIVMFLLPGSGPLLFLKST